MRRLFSLTVALLAFAGTAGAADGERKSVSEAIVKVEAKAAKLDANHDGWLDDNETAKGREKLGFLYGAVQAKLDANGDGRVSVKEYVDGQVMALRKADADHDGYLSQDEGKAQKRQLIQELLQHSGR
jgi:hypothetical protein